MSQTTPSGPQSLKGSALLWESSRAWVLPNNTSHISRIESPVPPADHFVVEQPPVPTCSSHNHRVLDTWNARVPGTPPPKSLAPPSSQLGQRDLAQGLLQAAQLSAPDNLLDLRNISSQFYTGSTLTVPSFSLTNRVSSIGKRNQAILFNIPSSSGSYLHQGILKNRLPCEVHSITLWEAAPRSLLPRHLPRFHPFGINISWRGITGPFVDVNGPVLSQSTSVNKNLYI